MGWVSRVGTEKTVPILYWFTPTTKGTNKAINMASC